MDKLIHAHIWAPHNSVFKSGKNEKAECTTISCSNSENCGLYARGECILLGVLTGQSCPYGRKRKEQGFTKKATAYRKWINEKESSYKDVGEVKEFSRILTTVGDYILLPYSFMNMNEKIPFLSRGMLFQTGSYLLPKESFTIENIILMCEFRPQAMMGGEITDYQKKEIPTFLKHLSEKMPDFFSELIKVYERAKTVLSETTNIGRKAVLKTLTPNAGAFTDIHGAQWVWDGEYLTSHNSKASFMLVDKPLEIRIKPQDNSIVKINSEDQVNDNTSFTS